MKGGRFQSKLVKKICTIIFFYENSPSLKFETLIKGQKRPNLKSSNIFKLSGIEYMRRKSNMF